MLTEECVAFNSRFFKDKMNRQVSVAEVTSKNFLRNSQNTVLRGVVLVLKRSDRPLQLYRPQNTKLKRPSPEGTYDRMAIIGQWNTKDCFVIISQSAQMSARLFTDRHLTVGSVVQVSEPVYTNTCLGNDLNNPIFETQRPLHVIVNVEEADFPAITIITLPQTITGVISMTFCCLGLASTFCSILRN